jgi:TonB family protein
MKRTLLLLMVTVLLVSNAVGQQPSGIGSGIGPGSGSKGPTRYTIDGEGFSVLLPTRPALTTTKVTRKDGKEQTKRFLTLTMNSVFYGVEIFENLKPAQPLEEFIAESSANLKFDVATERSLTVDGIAGKEYSSQGQTTTTVIQVFAAEDRLFRFAATGPPSATPEIKAFFSSIQLGKKPMGVDVSLEIFTGREVDTKARLITKPEPSYTDDARNNAVQGTVVLRAVFAKNGKVENIRVVSGLPNGLTERAINAAKQIKFVPAMKDGKPVSMWMQLEYNFEL